MKRMCNLRIALLFSAAAFTYHQSGTIWFGGTNETLSLNVTTQAFRGCMYNIGFSNTGVFQLFDTITASIQS